MRSGVCLVLVSSMSLSLAAGAPAATPVSPGNADGIAIVAGRCPTFHWTAEPGAETVELVVYRVSQNEEPADPVLAIALPGTAHGWTPSLDECLEPGGRYAWSVGADGGWSEARLFQIAAAPSNEELAAALAVVKRYADAGLVDTLEAEEPVEAGAAETASESESAKTPTRGGAPFSVDGAGNVAAASFAGDGSALLNVSASELACADCVSEGELDFDTATQGELDAHKVSGDHDGAYVQVAGDTMTGTLTLTPGAGSALISSSDIDLVGGNVLKNGTLFIHDNRPGTTALGTGALLNDPFGSNNTAVGENALQNNYYGYFYFGGENTAVGTSALQKNVDGSLNVALGYRALYENVGLGNVALGARALESNYGGGNVALGNDALRANSGQSNVAAGENALRSNEGSNNVAVGENTLLSNTTGRWNVAIGAFTARYGETGDDNVAIGGLALEVSYGDANIAIGRDALRNNTAGDINIGLGYRVLETNTYGSANVALGNMALSTLASGSGNIAIGNLAGSNVTGSGGDNILIGASGAASDDGVIRMGTAGRHTAAYVAGVRGTTTGIADALAVYIDSAGQLGTVSSSRRFKNEIRDMGSVSRALLDLRPVTFRLERAFNDGSRPTQFGLIAEEVADVLPELVVYDADGKPRAIRYHLLSPLLLNELQKQQREVRIHRWALAAALLSGVALLGAGRRRPRLG